MTEPTIRLFNSKDRAGCLAIFDQNVPTYFGETERADYCAFLDDLTCLYFVMELNGEIIGCGGYGTNDDTSNVGVFCWGMIAPMHHQKGYGKLLAKMRLNAMREDDTMASVVVNTSQRTAKFFEKLGFETKSITKDGFAEGLDNVEMQLIF